MTFNQVQEEQRKPLDYGTAVEATHAKKAKL